MPEYELSENEWSARFAHRLRKLAKDRGYKRKGEWAEIFGLSPNTISRYMNGHTIPDAYTIYHIANVLNCSVDDLIMVDDVKL